MKADLHSFAGYIGFVRLWLEFRGKYWDRLDDERRSSYMLDMQDGILPPAEESLSSIDV